MSNQASDYKPNQNNNDSNTKDSKATKFECSICLDVAKEPVVLRCGHLFCWPCIYFWNEKRKTCPNCNSGVGENDYIPIYNKEENSSNSKRFEIPNRPKGERKEPNEEERRREEGNGRQFNFSFGMFGFPFFFFSNNVNFNYQNLFGGLERNGIGLNNMSISNNESINKGFRSLVYIIILFILSINLGIL